MPELESEHHLNPDNTQIQLVPVDSNLLLSPLFSPIPILPSTLFIAKAEPSIFNLLLPWIKTPPSLLRKNIILKPKFLVEELNDGGSNILIKVLLEQQALPLTSPSANLELEEISFTPNEFQDRTFYSKNSPVLFVPPAEDETAFTQVAIDNNTFANSIINLSNTHLIYTFTFNKPVNDFDIDDIIVIGGTKGVFTAISPTQYTLEVELFDNVQSGEIIVGLIDNAIEGIIPIISKQAYDTQAPIVCCIEMSSSVLMPGQTALVTITFSEAVTHFSNSDVFAENASLSPFSTTDGGITWTALLTPYAQIQDNTNIITIAGFYTDLAGNIGSGGISENYIINNTFTTASIGLSSTHLKIGETSVVTITFSEPVSNFDNTDVIIQNGSLSTLVSSDGGVTWVTIFTPSSNIQDISNVITITPTYTNTSGQVGAGAISPNITIDTLTPTVSSITMSDMIIKSGDTILITITFSEAITNFDNSDVTVQSGTLSPLSSSDGGITWTANFTPTEDIEDLTNIITISANYTDIAGNDGTGSTSDNYIVDTLPPTVNSIDLSDVALKIGDTSTVTITFSEAVVDFDNNTLIVQNATLSTLSSSDGGITWTATLTPDNNIEDATNTITIATTYTDLAGNEGTSAVSSNYAIDTKAPAVSSIAMSDTALKIGETSTVTITFSEAVTGFDNSDVTVENGTLNVLTTGDGGITWIATFTPSEDVEDNTNVITVADTYTDLAGNAGTGAISANYTVETKGPTIVSITMSDTALKIGDTSTLTITFSKAVIEFDNSDVTVENGILSTLTSSDGGITWTGTVTPTANIEDTTNIVTVAATYTDIAGNAGTGSTSANYTVDTKAPTVTSITMSDSALKIGDTSTLTITFSEAVTGFDNSDITVENATLNTLSSSDGGITWTGTVTPTANIEDATNIVTVAATYTDIAGNTGTGSTSANYTVDTKAPTISSITMSDTALKIGETSTLTITFSEAVTGFNNSDVTVENATLSTLSSSNGGITWTGTVTPTANIEDATNIVTVAATYTDIAGNAGTGSTSANYTVDTKAPTVTSITMSDSALKIGDTSTLTITFSEAVTGFNNSDVTVENATLSTLSSSNGGITWTGTVTPAANIEDATNVITVASTYTDLAGNGGTGLSSANYTVDTKAPTVLSITMTDTALKIGDTAVVTIPFSERVTGFDSSDVAAPNGTLSTLTTADSGLTWTGTFTPTANVESPTNVISVGSSYADLAGNGGSTGSSGNYAVDTKAPTISITNDIAPGVLLVIGNVVFTFTFSEPVTGFTSSDITLNGGSKGTFTAVSSTVYKMVAIPLLPTYIVGTMSMTIPAGAAQDAAGNGSVAKSYTDNSSGQTGISLFDEVFENAQSLSLSDMLYDSQDSQLLMDTSSSLFKHALNSDCAQLYSEETAQHFG